VQFLLIIGSDTLSTLPLWKSYEELIANYDFWVYPRESNAYKQEFPSERFSLVDAQLLVFHQPLPFHNLKGEWML
jgi:nicotinic acid mononucleotide adenylyltransferase